MKYPALDKAIQQILARLSRLERKVFKPGPDKGTGKPDKDSVGTGLPAQILKLRDQHFFNEPRTAREVRERLKSKYACDHDRVAMALLRLQHRKQLRKTSKIVDKKKQLAYVR